MYRTLQNHPSGAEARNFCGCLAARLKPCPFKTRTSWISTFMRLPWTLPGRDLSTRIDATIKRIDGGSSSVAERLTVAQDVVGSIPTRRPNLHSRSEERRVGTEC